MALALRLVEPFDPLSGDPPPDRGVVVIDAALLADLVSRAHPGRDVSVHWGEPYGSSVDGRPIYEPVFTRHYREVPPAPPTRVAEVSGLDASTVARLLGVSRGEAVEPQADGGQVSPAGFFDAAAEMDAKWQRGEYPIQRASRPRREAES